MKSMTQPPQKTLLFFISVTIILSFIAGLFGPEKTAWATDENTTPDLQTKSAETTQSEAHREAFKKIKKRIDAAVAKAKKEGKTRIDIYLDEDPAIVQDNDLVIVSYTAILDDGRVISGTSPDKKDTRRIIAGKRIALPGLGAAVIGMESGGKKSLILEPVEAFGKKTKDSQVVLPARRVIPKIIQIDKKKYLETAKALPSKGETVPIAPYFRSEVIGITPDHIMVHNLARDGHIEQGPEGRTTVSVRGDEIIIQLTVKPGAIFYVGDRKGVILSGSEERFTVGFAHPFAGRKLHLDLEVVSFKKASVFRDIHIPWINDHDKGMQAAREKKKNKILILYADWCNWCEKMFDETFTDPRIKELKDQFVWVKANSDEDESLKAFYGHTGFPMIVLADDMGNIFQKTEGFKDADAFLADLEQMMNPTLAEADDN